MLCSFGKLKICTSNGTIGKHCRGFFVVFYACPLKLKFSSRKHRIRDKKCKNIFTPLQIFPDLPSLITLIS